MKLNLAIDQGNSSAKVSLFEGERLIVAQRYERLSCENLRSITAKNDVGAAIYSTVQSLDAEIDGYLRENVDRYICLTHTTPMPLKIDYATPATLGHDRIAVAVGAMHERPGENLLIIDAGTAVTLDAVSKDGHFLGGNITPGLRIRFESLHNFTDKLPLVTEIGEIPPIGKDTETAIRAGVVNGLVAEIDGIVASLTRHFGGLTVFITGGDGKFLASRMKFPSIEDDNLLAKGLNRIIIYNETI
jgi:type III pantothenate kinase